MEPDVRTYEYVVDREGTMWLGSQEVVNEAVIRLFLRNLEEEADGTLVMRCGRERNVLRPIDTPYVVRAASAQGGPGRAAERIVLHLGAGVCEELDPSTLCVGERHVLYARVRGGRFRARFTRGAYAQIAEHVAEDGRGGFVLRLSQRDFPIAAAG